MEYLLLSIFFSTSILWLFSWYGKKKVHLLLSLAVNYLVASTLSLFLIHSIPIFSWWMASAMVLGILFMVVFWLMAKSTQISGLAATSLAAKLSMVFPILAGISMYREFPLPAQWIGISLAFAAVFFTTERQSSHVSSRWMPLWVFLGAGTTDTLIGYHSRVVPNQDQYLLYALVFGFAGLTGFFFFLRNGRKGESVGLKKGFLAGILLGLVNFGSMYFIFQSIKTGIPQSVFFPANNIGIVVLASIGGIFLFKDMPKRATWIGLLLGLGGLVWLLLPSMYAAKG